MKLVIDINKMYYETLKYDVEVNHMNYLPCVLIANGKPLQKNKMMHEIYMEGVKMPGDQYGRYVHFKNIKKIVDKYIKESEEV